MSPLKLAVPHLSCYSAIDLARVARILMGRVLKARSTIERAVLAQGPATDWLLERGYITLGTSNAAARVGFAGRWAASSPYATRAGRAWYHAGPPAGVALVDAAKALRLSLNR
jgi:hypothetical protein